MTANKTKKCAPKLRFKGFTEDWEEKKLKNLVKFSKGNGYSKADLKESGTPIILYGRLYTNYETIINEVDTFADKKPKSVISKGGEVIVPASGETAEDISVASVVEKPGILLGGDLNILHPSDKLDATFLALSISNGKPHRDMAKRAQGKSIVHLHNTDLAQINLYYPSLPEQQKIGALFSNLDHLIALHDAKCDNLKTLKKAMLQKMFPKKGETTPEVRFKGFDGAWEEKKVGELTNILSASRVHKDEWTEEGVPFFRSSDVVSAFKGNDNEKVFISFELYNQLIKSSGKLEKNDILITGGGSIGIPYIVPDNNPLYSKDADLIWIKHSSKFDSRFLYTYFISESFRNYIKSISHIGIIAHYTIKQVKETPVIIPSIEEQQKIGAYFANLDALIAEQTQKVANLKALKKGLLRQMFV